MELQTPTSKLTQFDAAANRNGACTVQISGGLGNQLFQYAAARALSLRNRSETVLDISFFNRGRHRAFELGGLPIDASVNSGVRAPRFLQYLSSLTQKVCRFESTYREASFHFDPKFHSLQTPVRLEGYFQSERYFAEFREALLQELAPPQPEDKESLKLAKQMVAMDSAVMHVRRGDYISNPKASRIYCECTIDYYSRAMQMIPGNDAILVLSDDIAWARDNIPPVKRLIFPEINSSRSALADLWLMTQARHHIIANSTFSWWGAWLSTKGDAINIAPKQWFQDPDIDDSDLTPDNWIRI